MTDVSRRAFLGMAGAAAGAATVLPALAACGSGKSRSVSNAGKDLAPWPTYAPFKGPKPDLAGDAHGVQNCYLTYPKEIVRSVRELVGDGTDVTALVITYSTPPKPLDSNGFWKAVNAALGVNLKLITVPDSEYAAKMATVMASGDLPDIILFGAGYTLPREQQFIETKCADLSDHLSGDHIKTYPNLANIPPYAWRGVGRIAGKLYGVPIERPLPGNSLLVNRTALAGVPTRWSKDEFNTAMKGYTRGRRWGIGGSTTGFGQPSAAPSYHAGAFGAPNQWKLSGGGKFVSTYESAQYQEALAFMRGLHDAGAFYPDSLSTSQVDLKSLFYNQTLLSITDGYGAYQGAVTAVKEQWLIDFALPYHTGTDWTPWQGNGRFGYAVFRKAPKKRIEMLLRVLNFLAAPFGTTEYELCNFGVEGTHFTRGDAGIVLTDLAKTENNGTLPIKYVANAPLALYLPGFPAAAKRVWEWEKALLPKSVADPSNGIRSATYTAQGATLDKMLSDSMSAIVFGRAPVSSWKDTVKQWKSAGGDKVAAEYAKEYAAVH
jgi:putative aldouronate transport system substrate-binding protein